MVGGASFHTDLVVQEAEEGGLLLGAVLDVVGVGRVREEDVGVDRVTVGGVCHRLLLVWLCGARR